MSERVAASARSDGRAARRSRVAGVGLVLVLLAVSVFAVVGSQVTAAAAGAAVESGAVSDDYWRAVSAVDAEQASELRYRLEPSYTARTGFDRSAVALTAALGEVRRDGDDADLMSVERVDQQHGVYQQAAELLFAAIDGAAGETAVRLAANRAESAFLTVESTVRDAANDQQREAVAALEQLEDIEVLIRVLTPAVFVAGLLLAALLASITRGHRRLLRIERERAVHDAQHDRLTGLPNRVLFTERAEQALAAGGAPRRTDDTRGTGAGGVALLLVDLDRFKDINDTFGHHCGDEVIMQVGERLIATTMVGAASGGPPGSAVVEVDTVARLGGDEFGVVLREVDSPEHALAAARTLQTALEAPFLVDGVDLDVEASVGVAISSQHGSDAVTLMQRADIAMYEAKRQGRDVAVYDPATDRHSPEKLALLSDLRRALQQGELVLHYQPKVAIDTGQVVGVEALVRWQRPRHGLVGPAEFMPYAEHTGLVRPLTRCVLTAAITQAGRWRRQGRPRTVAVNLSARNLLDDDLPDHITDLLRTHDLPAGLLTLEVTESAVVTEPVRAKQLLERLSDLGVRIAIDDFGAGYTSLAQLTTLPISELKIDQSFVTDMTDNPGHALIVQSVIDLGHNFALAIVAEGVEDEQTLTALASLGCDIAQGYHLGRPVSAEALDTVPAARLDQASPTIVEDTGTR